MVKAIKLHPKSTPCIFLGYSTSKSAYKCLDLKTGKLYLSGHVQFVEHEFPRLTGAMRIFCSVQESGQPRDSWSQATSSATPNPAITLFPPSVPIPTTSRPLSTTPMSQSPHISTSPIPPINSPTPAPPSLPSLSQSPSSAPFLPIFISTTPSSYCHPKTQPQIF